MASPEVAVRRENATRYTATPANFKGREGRAGQERLKRRLRLADGCHRRSTEGGRKGHRKGNGAPAYPGGKSISTLAKKAQLR